TVLRANDWIAFVAKFMEIAVVGPDILREFKLTDQARADHEGRDAAVRTIVWSVIRQRQAISSATANHAAPGYVRCRVAGVHATHVRTEGYRISMRVHLFVVEVVASLHVGAQFRIFLVWSQH